MPPISPHDFTPDYDPDDLPRIPPRTLHFACTGCGKCCNASPTMTIEEGFDLADVFLMSAMLRFSPLKDDVHRTGHPTFADRDVPMPIHVELHCKTMGWTEHNNRCSALRDDMKCGIYERRPTMCRVVPFDLHLRPDLVNKLPQWEEAEGRAHGFECDWSDKAPVIVTPKGIVDPQYREPYEKGRALMEASQEYIKVIPEGFLMQRWQAIKERFRGRGNEDTLMPFSNFVVAAVALGRMDMDRAREILAHQVRIAERLEAEALQRRDKAERNTTNAIREIRKVCKMTLTDLEQLVAEAGDILAQQGADLPEADIDHDAMMEMIQSMSVNTAPEGGAWRDWQDAAWAGFLSKMRWDFEYVWQGGAEGPAFRLARPDAAPVDAWTVEQNPVPGDTPDSDSFVSFHGDYRSKNGPGGILLLLIELGQWRQGGINTTLMGWWLPPNAASSEPWRMVCARGGAARAGCLPLDDLLRLASPSQTVRFTAVDDAAGHAVATSMELAQAEAGEQGYRRMFMRKMAERMAEFEQAGMLGRRED